MSNQKEQMEPDISMILQCYERNPQPFLLLRSEKKENGTQELQAVYGNPAFFTLIHTGPAVLEGMLYQELLQDQSEAHRAQLLAAAEQGTSVLLELPEHPAGYLMLQGFRIAPGLCGCLLSCTQKPPIYADLERLEENLNC